MLTKTNLCESGRGDTELVVDWVTRERSLGIDSRLIQQHNWDVVLDGIDAPTARTFQRFPFGNDGDLAFRADENFEQLLINHGEILQELRD